MGTDCVRFISARPTPSQSPRPEAAHFGATWRPSRASGEWSQRGSPGLRGPVTAGRTGSRGAPSLESRDRAARGGERPWIRADPTTPARPREDTGTPAPSRRRREAAGRGAAGRWAPESTCVRPHAPRSISHRRARARKPRRLPAPAGLPRSGRWAPEHSVLGVGGLSEGRTPAGTPLHAFSTLTSGVGTPPRPYCPLG